MRVGKLHSTLLNESTHNLIKRGIAKRGIASRAMITKYPSLVFKVGRKENPIAPSSVNVSGVSRYVVNRFLSMYLSLPIIYKYSSTSLIQHNIVSKVLYSKHTDHDELNTVASDAVNFNYIDIFREFTKKKKEGNLVQKYDFMNILPGKKYHISNRLYSIEVATFQTKSFGVLTTIATRQAINLTSYLKTENSKQFFYTEKTKETTERAKEAPKVKEAPKDKEAPEAFQNIYETKFLKKYQLNTCKINANIMKKEKDYILIKTIKDTIQNRLFRTYGVNILNLNSSGFNSAKATYTLIFDSTFSSSLKRFWKEKSIVDDRRRALLDFETILFQKSIGQKVVYNDTQESHIKSLRSQWNDEKTEVLKTTARLDHVKQKLPVTMQDTPVPVEIKHDTAVSNLQQNEIQQNLPDINQLVNMVYQEIENRLKLHKERMGL